jgi:hypothetical protein
MSAPRDTAVGLRSTQKPSAAELDKLLAQGTGSASCAPSAADPSRAVDAPIKSSPGLAVEVELT